jgi:hypothetical protein
MVVDTMTKRAEDTTIAELASCDNPSILLVEGQTRSQCAYLVRCWREKGTTVVGPPSWRFSVEEVFGERRRRGFRSLEGLIAFIQAGMQDAEAGPDQAE